MGHMEQPAQAVGNGMAQAQPPVGKGKPRHGGGQMDFQPHLFLSGIGRGQGGIRPGKGLPGQKVREGPGIHRHIAFQGVGQHIEARVGNEGLGKALQQVAVQDRHIGPQPPVHQRVLHPLVGENGKIRHLGAGAGGGGDCRQGKGPLGKIGHGLGAVHGAAAPQSHQQVRAKGLQLGRALRRQGHTGVRHNPIKDLHRFPARSLRYTPGRSVLREEGVRNQEHPLRPELLQRRHGTGPGDNPGLTGESFHISSTAFSRPSISQPRQSMRPDSVFFKIGVGK